MAVKQIQFSASIADFVKDAKARTDDVLRLSAAEVFRRIIQRSPVDSGRFRGAWTLNTAELAYKPGQGPRFDKDGRLAITEADVVARQINAGQTIVISNPMPYGPRLEYGWSKQAPAGMVRITLVEWPAIVRNAVARARTSGG